MMTTVLAAPRRAQRLIHSSIAALVIAAVTGCGGDSATGPGNENPSGLYSLRQVAGDAIPARIYRGPLPGIPEMTIGVTGGELILDQDGAFGMALDLTLGAPNGPTIPRIVRFEGNYEVNGGTLTLIDGSGNGVDGSLRNGVVTVGLDVVGNGVLKPFTFKFVP